MDKSYKELRDEITKEVCAETVRVWPGYNFYKQLKSSLDDEFRLRLAERCQFDDKFLIEALELRMREMGYKQPICSFEDEDGEIAKLASLKESVCNCPEFECVPFHAKRCQFLFEIAAYNATGPNADDENYLARDYADVDAEMLWEKVGKPLTSRFIGYLPPSTDDYDDSKRQEITTALRSEFYPKLPHDGLQAPAEGAYLSFVMEKVEGTVLYGEYETANISAPLESMRVDYFTDKDYIDLRNQLDEAEKRFRWRRLLDHLVTSKQNAKNMILSAQKEYGRRIDAIQGKSGVYLTDDWKREASFRELYKKNFRKYGAKKVDLNTIKDCVRCGWTKEKIRPLFDNVLPSTSYLIGNVNAESYYESLYGQAEKLAKTPQAK